MQLVNCRDKYNEMYGQQNFEKCKYQVSSEHFEFFWHQKYAERKAKKKAVFLMFYFHKLPSKTGKKKFTKPM